jgi:isoleucyl-tRNA synthetase
MKYQYPANLLPIVKKLLSVAGSRQILLEEKKLVDSFFGYHFLSAAQIIDSPSNSFYAMQVEELMQVARKRSSSTPSMANLFVKLQAQHLFNEQTLNVLKEDQSLAYIDVIADFFNMIQIHQPQLLSVTLFSQLCQSAANLDDVDIRNAFFEKYVRLGRSNPLTVATIWSLLNLSRRDQSLSIEDRKQALLSLARPHDSEDTSVVEMALDDKSLQTRASQYDLSFVDQSADSRESSLVSRWERMDLYRQAIRRPGKPLFVTYDGPPFATGLPHYGHVLAMSIKSAISSHKAMTGFDVETRFGWDCHGVPVEMIVQKKLGLDNHQNIMRMGIEGFNNECRRQIFSCVDAWEKDTKRMGRFIDMGLGNDYRTMDADYMSSVWSVFGQLHKKGLIYKGFKVVPYSPSLGTALSDFEAGLEYKKIISPSIALTFPLVGEEQTQFIVWTTTPWSVPANVAVAINPQYPYVKVHANGNSYILLKSRYQQYFKQLDQLTVEDIDIRTYLNRQYLPVFDCLPGSLSDSDRDRCYRIVESSHVTESDGTGCVHICPAYGLDDYNVGQRYDLPIVDFIDANGVFKTVATRSGESLAVEGLYFKSYKIPESPSPTPHAAQEVADVVLIKKMRENKRLFKNETVHHDYPLCWRTHQPLMYRAINSWFVKVSAFKEDLLKNNAQVNWHPESVGSYRFANWLTSARDWAISRTRYWGCPIPVWVDVDNPDDILVVDSKRTLEEMTGRRMTDLHREHIDDIEIVRNGKRYRRISEVLDCWFESGSMPYAQYGLTFKGDEAAFLETRFPAEFIAEGLDQTRGWFYALSVLGTALFGKIPFRNVIVNGILLGNDGKKMSKSERNYPPIDETFRQYGADVMRLFLLGSHAVRADNVAIKDELFREINQNYVVPLLNIFKFFGNAANARHLMITAPVNIRELLSGRTFGKLNPFDEWLVYRVEMFKKLMCQHLESYDLLRGAQQIKDYILDLTHWYVRMSRSRVSLSNPVVIYLLHYALDAFAHQAAPYMPFISESIYRGLYPNQSSIHLRTYPEQFDVTHLAHAYQTVEQVRQIYTMTLALREEHRLRLRQPIDSIYLDEQYAATLQPYEDILKNLVNCKHICWVNPTRNALFEKSIQLVANLGKLLKQKFQGVPEWFKSGDYRLSANGETLTFSNGLTLSLANQEFFYVVKTTHPDYACQLKGNIWVVIHTKLTPELIHEGIGRDFLRELVRLRIQQKYQLTDVMELYIPVVHQALVQPFASMLTQKGYRIEWVESLDTTSLHNPRQGFSMNRITIGERGSTAVSFVSKKREGSMEFASTDGIDDGDEMSAESTLTLARDRFFSGAQSAAAIGEHNAYQPH